MTDKRDTINIHCIQHVAFEDAGSINDWAKGNGHRMSVTKLYNNERLPKVGSIDWLVVMGGPMGVYDEAQYVWLKTEKEFIKAAIDQGKTVIGICLGAQLIANVLGADIYKNPYREIGWFPVRFNSEHPRNLDIFPEILPVFHWHSDTFDIPKGATCFANSEACKNQAFDWHHHVFGFQFHLEMTQKGAAALVRHCGREIERGKYIQRPEEILSVPERFREINRTLNGFLGRIAGEEMA